MKQACVIGAGLSGLAAAWRLRQLGMRVDVYEAGDRPGGLIATTRTAYGLVEAGANAFVETPAARELFAAAGVTPAFARRESRRRFVFRDGRPRRWPLTPGESTVAAARLAWAWGTGATRARPGESAAGWADRVLGPVARRRLVEPALFGVYGAPAARLSAEALSLGRRRTRAALIAPVDGMGALVGALHNRLVAQGVRFHFSAPVVDLDAGVPTLVCTSAQAGAPLLARAGFTEAADALLRVPMLPLVTATAFFAPHHDDLRGFGVLFPEGTARARGVLFNAEIFEGRGPFRSETWIYAGPGLLKATDEQVEAAIVHDRWLLTGGRRRPESLIVTRVPAALPLYGPHLLAAREAVRTLPPWLRLCGNYLGRIGVSALVEDALGEARRWARDPPGPDGRADSRRLTDQLSRI